MGIEDITQIKERQKRLEQIFAQPDLMEVICNYIANGGTIVTLAEAWDVRYSDLTAWIHQDKFREQAYIKALNDRAEWGREIILRELRRIGLSDIKKIFEEDGSLKPVSQWPEEMGSVVSSIEVNELFDGVGRQRKQVGEVKKVKLWDKIKSLELIGKNMVMFTDKVQHGVEPTLEEILARSWHPDGKENKTKDSKDSKDS